MTARGQRHCFACFLRRQREAASCLAGPCSKSRGSQVGMLVIRCHDDGRGMSTWQWHVARFCTNAMVIMCCTYRPKARTEGAHCCQQYHLPREAP
jgi:hypothetical protein